MKKLLLFNFLLLASVITGYSYNPVEQKVKVVRGEISGIDYRNISVKNGILCFASQDVLTETLNALEKASSDNELERHLTEENRMEETEDAVLFTFEKLAGFDNSLRQELQKQEIEALESGLEPTANRDTHINSPLVQTVVNKFNEIMIGEEIIVLKDKNYYFKVYNSNFETLEYIRGLRNLSDLEYKDDLFWGDLHVKYDSERALLAPCSFTMKTVTVGPAVVEIDLIPINGVKNPKFTWEIVSEFNGNILVSGSGSKINEDLSKLISNTNPVINGITINVTMTADGDCNVKKDFSTTLNCGGLFDDAYGDMEYSVGDEKGKLTATLWMDNYVFYTSIGTKVYNYTKKGKKWKQTATDEIGLQFAKNSYFLRACNPKNLPWNYDSKPNTDTHRWEDKEKGLYYDQTTAVKGIVSCDYFVTKSKTKVKVMSLTIQ